MWVGANKKPTGQLLLAVGFLSPKDLCFSAHQAPSPRRHANSCRCNAHRCNSLSLSLQGNCFHGCCSRLILVVLLAAQSRVRLLRFKFFKELHQSINQSAPASDDMEPALMLMLFQDFV